MNKKQKLVRKKHRKTRDRLKALKIISLTKVKKRPKAFTKPEVEKQNVQEITSHVKLPEKEAAVKKSPAKKSPAKKSPAKKSPAKKSPAKKSPAKKSPAKKSPAKKSPAKKAPAKKAN